MAQTSALSALTPEHFSATAEIFDDDCHQVAEMLNYAAQYFPVTHASLLTGTFADGVPFSLGDEATSLGTTFPGSTTFREVLRFAIDVYPETTTLVFGARCVIITGSTGEVRVQIGARPYVGAAATATISFTDADNGTEKNTTISTGTSGTGELEVVVSLRLSTVFIGGEFSYMRNFRLEDAPLASLPDSSRRMSNDMDSCSRILDKLDSIETLLREITSEASGLEARVGSLERQVEKLSEVLMTGNGKSVTSRLEKIEARLDSRDDHDDGARSERSDLAEVELARVEGNKARWAAWAPVLGSIGGAGGLLALLSEILSRASLP